MGSTLRVGSSQKGERVLDRPTRRARASARGGGEPMRAVSHTQLALFSPPAPRGTADPRPAIDKLSGRADLHVHSYWSDGAQAPQTLVKRAAGRLDVLAI